MGNIHNGKEVLPPQTPASSIPSHPSSSVTGAPKYIPFENELKSSPAKQLVGISEGDSLSEVLMENIGEKFPGFDKLTPKGQANFIYNILSNLDPNQLKEIGVSSMDAGSLSLDDKIDFQKLHDIAQKMEITYGGKSISLFERAKLL